MHSLAKRFYDGEQRAALTDDVVAGQLDCKRWRLKACHQWRTRLRDATRSRASLGVAQAPLLSRSFL